MYINTLTTLILLKKIFKSYFHIKLFIIHCPSILNAINIKERKKGKVIKDVENQFMEQEAFNLAARST
jgi:hypothetical protein